MKQTVRVIAGKYKGKKIHFPAVPGLRPTPDRVKETVFNWLMHDINGANCLDLFAGSGSLGLEALSRGAREVTFVEQSAPVAKSIKQTLQDIKVTNATLHIGNGLKFLEKTTSSFDIVFLDPPFNKGMISPCLKLLMQTTVLKQNGLVYAEAESIDDEDIKQWNCLRQKKASQVSYLLLQKKSLTTIPTS